MQSRYGLQGGLNIRPLVIDITWIILKKEISLFESFPDGTDS